jgi:hypothetical protein
MVDHAAGELRVDDRGWHRKRCLLRHVAVLAAAPDPTRGMLCLRVEVASDVPCEVLAVRDPIGCYAAWWARC